MPEARLTISRSSQAPTEIVLGNETRIGRAADNDVVLEDPSVSRRHALVRKVSEDEFLLIDLGSANGTEVNGEPLRLPSRLTSGDVVRIGSSTLTFFCERAEPPPCEELDVTRTPARREPVLLGTGSAMADLFRLLDRAASSNLPVLILGETGTGKELVARAVHAGSSRRSAAFVVVSCAALAESPLDSEVFADPATRPSHARVGRLEEAAGGSLFLDEVADLPASLQARLLRILEGVDRATSEGEGDRRLDVRVISATNRELTKEVELGRFRADLFYRLAGFTIPVPALRERREDIPLLCERFLLAAAQRQGRRVGGIDERALELLERFDWPGNVRELKNEIERAVSLVGNGHRIGAEHLSPGVRSSSATPRLAPEKNDAPARRPSSAAVDELLDTHVFRRDGDFWTLVYEGTMVLVRGNKGFHHIACLLAMPGREYAVQDLALDAESEMGSLAAADAGHQDLGSEVTTSLGDAGPALDGRAKAEYRRRLTELNQELEQAERNNDPGGAERARAEIDFLMQQISSAVGLAGRDRPTGSHNERARILVTQRIRTAIKRISESHPSLGDHLTASLHTGYRCVYRPPGDLPITWRT